jgi:hypothetical protein
MVALSNGGVIEFANVSTQSGAQDTITVDASSSFEIGSMGGAIAGAFTLDPGHTLVDGGTFTAPIIVDNGTIEVGADESLSLNGTGTGLIGIGLVQIDAGATLTLAAVGKQSQNSLLFAGNSGVLALSHGSLNAALAFLPVISGFNSSDRIEFQGDASNVSYANGKLTLFNNGATVATFTLAGNYAGDEFYVIDNNGTTQLTVSTGGDTPSAPAGTSSSDTYAWTPNLAGSWDNALNWVDPTAGQTPALAAPGAEDVVTISAAPGVTDIVTGTGNSASLTLGGSLDLKTQLSTGTATLNNYASVLIDTAASLTDTGAFNEGYRDQLMVGGGILSVTGNFNAASL